MADVFELRRELDSWRGRLWPIIESTPWLDWLLLTKRPENVSALAPWRSRWPNNVWLGTTAETQSWAEKRISKLVESNANLLFLSAEPLLGPINLARWLGRSRNRGLDWVIAGGESGPAARPMNPAWAKLLRDQCVASGVPFHFKQWGHWSPYNDFATKARIVEVSDAGERVQLFRMGKHASGRMLDGRTWDEFPTAIAQALAIHGAQAATGR